MQTLLRNGYGVLTDVLLDERKEAQLPPFVHMVLLRSDSSVPGEARAFLQHVRDWLLTSFTDLAAHKITILGPADAPIERLGGRHRAQLQLHSEQRRPLHRLLSTLRPSLEKNPMARKVRWSLDVDPHDML